MTVAGDRVSPAGGFDANLRPEHTGGNVHGGHLRHGDALFVTAEETRLHATHALRAYDEPRGKQEVAMRPATGGERVAGAAGGGSRGYTHSSAPFFHTQM